MDVNIKCKTIKFQKKILTKKSTGCRTSQNVLRLDTKRKGRKSDKSDFIKIKNISSAKDPVMRDFDKNTFNSV